MRYRLSLSLLAPAALFALAAVASAGEVLPWQAGQNDYQPAPYQPPAAYGQPQAAYPAQRPRYPKRPVVEAQPAPDVYADAPPPPAGVLGPVRDTTYGPDDISRAGHRFFGRITTDLASVIEYAFRSNGRPNGYILGEEGGGAFVAGLRYGEGALYTKNAGTRKVFWQGPSIGYDFGGEGSKAMILVYNLNSPEDVYYDYVGVGGQAYVVGGVGMTYLKSGPVTMAPIRSGLGLRIGANVGYLKFTREPTWNPF
jgi:hypothetical protein